MYLVVGQRSVVTNPVVDADRRSTLGGNLDGTLSCRVGLTAQTYHLVFRLWHAAVGILVTCKRRASVDVVDGRASAGAQIDGGSVRNRNRVWWIQAETINGFYNAWEMTGESKYSAACLAQWKWIQNFQKDKKGGEWWNAVDVNGKPILTEDKGGNWKTSYHNGRTCLELLRRSGYSATGQ